MRVNMASGALVIAIQFEYDIAKTQTALAYFAGKRLPAFDPDKAMALLFLADREHLLRFGRTITGDRYEARNNGPVAVETEKLHLLDNPTSTTMRKRFPIGSCGSGPRGAGVWRQNVRRDRWVYANLTAYRARMQAVERPAERFGFFAGPRRAPILQEIKEAQQCGE